MFFLSFDFLIWHGVSILLRYNIWTKNFILNSISNNIMIITIKIFSHQNIFQSKHCNTVVFKFFVHVAYGFLYSILTGFPHPLEIQYNSEKLEFLSGRLIILLSKCTLSSVLPYIWIYIAIRFSLILRYTCILENKVQES